MAEVVERIVSDKKDPRAAKLEDDARAIKLRDTILGMLVYNQGSRISWEALHGNLKSFRASSPHLFFMPILMGLSISKHAGTDSVFAAAPQTCFFFICSHMHKVCLCSGSATSCAHMHRVYLCSGAPNFCSYIDSL